MSESTVLIETSNRVRTLTMNRPKAKNAFNNVMYQAMAAAVAEADADDEIGAILLTGAGGAYSAGQDLSEMKMPEPGEPLGFELYVDALVACSKPVIAAVNGVAVGIGTTMLLHTDVNFVSEAARFRLPFAPLGVAPEAGSSYLLMERVGAQRAAELLLSGRWFSAAEAVMFGLAIELLSPGSLMPRAQAFAEELAGLPPSSVQTTKRLMKAAHNDLAQAARDRENDAFRDLLGSPENMAALQKFFAKK